MAGAAATVTEAATDTVVAMATVAVTAADIEGVMAAVAAAMAAVEASTAAVAEPTVAAVDIAKLVQPDKNGRPHMGRLFLLRRSDRNQPIASSYNQPSCALASSVAALIHPTSVT